RGTSLRPCTRLKPETSWRGASVRERILSLRPQTFRTLRLFFEALRFTPDHHRIRRAPSESPSSVREAETRAGSDSPVPAPDRESCCGVRALRVLWSAR